MSSLLRGLLRRGGGGRAGEEAQDSPAPAHVAAAEPTGPEGGEGGGRESASDPAAPPATAAALHLAVSEGRPALAPASVVLWYNGFLQVRYVFLGMPSQVPLSRPGGGVGGAERAPTKLRAQLACQAAGPALRPPPQQATSSWWSSCWPPKWTSTRETSSSGPPCTRRDPAGPQPAQRFLSAGGSKQHAAARCPLGSPQLPTQHNTPCDPPAQLAEFSPLRPAPPCPALLCRRWRRSGWIWWVCC